MRGREREGGRERGEEKGRVEREKGVLSSTDRPDVYNVLPCSSNT